MKHTRTSSQGQALITMLFIMVIGVLVTTGAVFALYNNTSIASNDELGMIARTTAEAGIENALLRIIRDPAYVGETIDFGGGRSAIVTVASSSSQLVTSVGTISSVTRKLQVGIQYNQGILTIVSWSEIP